MTDRGKKILKLEYFKKKKSFFDEIKSIFHNYLKHVSTIFYQIFIFHKMIALSKLWKMFLISSKKFRFLYFHLPLFFSMVLFTRQDSTEFENFQSEFDKLLSKTVSIKFLFIIFLGDFYTRSLSWWKEHKTT